MIYIHLLMAVLAAWRITELFTQDRVTAKLRDKWKTYLWQCPRCMSVWAGAWVTLVFAMGQRWGWVLWLNWPFAVAWAYLIHVDTVVSRRTLERGRRLTIELSQDGQYKFNSELTQPEAYQLLGLVMQQFGGPVKQPNGEAKPFN